MNMDENISSEKYSVNVDLVLCIDCTGSMGPVIDMVKKNALTFHEQITKALEKKDREVEQLRIKVIGFRDLTYGEDMEESKFFDLPQENEAFEKFVNGLQATGGGDAPETALDAIAYAMKSPWVKEGSKKRHIIMLWTDAPTKMPGEQTLRDDLPKSIAEFRTWYDDPQEAKMNAFAKRLIVFAPDDPSWDCIQDLPLTNISRVDLDKGLSEVTIDIVLTMLANSV
ncbi:vWA domain-containing protein [Methanomethylophilus alvi]